jgi:hypothetical protein
MKYQFWHWIILWPFLSSDLDSFVDKDAFNMYISLQKYLHDFVKSCSNFKKDDSIKKFKFEFQVSVVTLTVIVNMSYLLRS